MRPEAQGLRRSKAIIFLKRWRYGRCDRRLPRGVFRGTQDLRVLLGAVYSTTRGMRWTEEVGDGAARVLIGEFKVAALRMTDAMAFDLAPDGRIRRIRPHLRPLLGTMLFAAILGPKVAVRPGVVLRALRG